MRPLAISLASATVVGIVVVAVGCGNDNSTVCAPYQYAGAGYAPPQCEAAGGICSGSCPPGYEQAPASSPYANACSYPYDPNYNGCGPPPPQYGGPASPASGVCCLPSSDGGADGATDAPSDARADAHDAAPQNGSCAGTPCNAGCSCEVLPQTQAPYCACVDAGESEAGAPNCGSIWCFAGCTCADVSLSVCACP